MALTMNLLLMANHTPVETKKKDPTLLSQGDKWATAKRNIQEWLNPYGCFLPLLCFEESSGFNTNATDCVHYSGSQDQEQSQEEFLEGNTNVIDLPEEDVVDIEELLQYAYTDNYRISIPRKPIQSCH